LTSRRRQLYDDEAGGNSPLYPLTEARGIGRQTMKATLALPLALTLTLLLSHVAAGQQNPNGHLPVAGVAKPGLSKSWG